MKIVSVQEFKKAREQISPWIRQSPFSYFRTLSERVGSQVYVKKENEQRTGSFKVRGAINKVLSLSAKEKKRGLVSCSAGNHAQGVAYAAHCMKTSALLVLPENTPIVKEQAVRHYSAEVILQGRVYDESYEYALQLSHQTRRCFIHAYQDHKVIAGQGSIALEILEQAPDIDAVVVPVGGGGLMSGIACVIKEMKPNCRVYGVVSSMAPAMEYLFHQRIYTPEQHFFMGGLTDGITVKHPSQEMFESYISKYVDDIVSVTDDEVAEAIVLLLERGKTLVEGAGAVSVAALLKQDKKWNIGKKCGLILSGGNIDLNILSQVVERGLKKGGRLGRLSVVTKDQPGSLNKITHLLSQMQANILSIHHERNSPHLSYGLAEIQFLIETRGSSHLDHIRSQLKQQVYEMKEE
ncbi:MAG: threonine ammonia-lyase [Bdellovibrionales bacterium]|nr:threonine ammonia-lyase [Bdellovibrionales bacterium]